MQANQHIHTLVALTPAEFEQLARDVFALVQRDRTEAEIDVGVSESASIFGWSSKTLTTTNL